jgi:hypothetical protein
VVRKLLSGERHETVHPLVLLSPWESTLVKNVIRRPVAGERHETVQHLILLSLRPKDLKFAFVTETTDIAGVYRQNTGSTTEMVQSLFYSTQLPTLF